MPNITSQLADFITGPADMPPDLLRAAERIVIDTFGAIVSGAGGEVAAPLLAYVSGTAGTVPIFGTGVKTTAELAAFVNGSFGHALEFDDVFSMMPGHPAAVIVAALAGELQGVSGKALTEAFVIGYEVGARIGIAITLEHHRIRGFHATSTLGIFAAAAALARLRGYDAGQAARTISIAASFASGLLGQTGTVMKPVHSGWAARNALAAADMVRAGLGSNEDLLEAPRGFFNAYGTPASRVERIMDGIAAPWAIQKPGVSLKKYPCCFAAHRGIEGVLQLRRENALRLEDVAEIECRLPPKGLINMVYTRPQTGLQAKFSMEYCFLAALLDGEVTLSTFTNGQVLRPVAQVNLPLVKCIEDPACEEGLGEASGEVSGARGYTQMTLTTKSGARHVAKVAHAPGTPARPMTEDDMRGKLAICLQYAGVPVELATGLLFAYPDAPDLSPLLDALKGGAA